MNQRLSDRIREDLLARISAGILKPSDKMPSERDLAQKYGVSKTTARQAVATLVQDGFLCRLPNGGTVVATNRGALDTEHNGGMQTVAVLMPDLNERFFHQILSGIERTLSDAGMGMLLSASCNDPIVERKALLNFVNSTAKGIIVLSRNYSSTNLDLLQEIADSTPLVIIDVEIPGLSADMVVSDDRDGAYQVVDHLVQLGHTNILHIAGPTGDSSAEERLAGYFDALSHHGIPHRQELVRTTDWSARDGYCEMKKVLLNAFSPTTASISRGWDGCPEDREAEQSAAERFHPTAVFACNDDVAVGVYQAVREFGLSVPEDIALAGYSDYAENVVGFMLETPLTSVDQSAPTMGSHAVRLILAKLSGRRPMSETVRVVMPTKLMIRQSCGILVPRNG